MPPRGLGVNRVPSNSVNDRPGRFKLLLRRQRRFLRPTILAGAVLGVCVLSLAAVRSSRPGGAIDDLRDRLARASGTLGLRVSEVMIEGRANTPEPLLRKAIGVRPGDPILGFSLDRARERVEHLSWVDHATIERRLPGTIVVQLQERRPFAVWQNQGKFVLIDRAGEVVTNSNIADFRELPLVVGAGAPRAAATLIDALTDRPAFAGRFVAAVRVGERRWNLVMKSGLTVMLPEGHEAVALDRLIEFDKGHRLLERPLQVVDMRLPDRLVLRPRPDDTAATAPPKKPT